MQVESFIVHRGDSRWLMASVLGWEITPQRFNRDEGLPLSLYLIIVVNSYHRKIERCGELR